MDIDTTLIYTSEETPLGKPWSQWTEEWWKWLLSIPASINPANDSSGELFDRNQGDNEVLFLAGTKGGSAVREISIPLGKSILIPIINFETNYREEPELKNQSELIARAKKDIDDISRKEAIIDNVSLEEYISKCRVLTQPFEVTLPENNLFGIKAGPTTAVSDGYWLFIKPLPEGDHQLHVSGACSSGRTSIDVTWYLHVRK